MQLTVRTPSFTRTDLLIIILSVAILVGSIWVWSAASSISREVVFFATTIALIIALVLTVNITILVLVRLQHRISSLEATLVKSGDDDDDSGRVIVVTLTNTERRILNRLEENDGVLPQDELRRVTGLSKSTLSVALSALERKSLIHRENYGKTKLVTLESSVRR